MDAEDDDIDEKKQQGLKEKALEQARLKHVTAALQERVRFLLRPMTKAGYEDLFNESALIKNALSGSQPRRCLETRLALRCWLRHGAHDRGEKQAISVGMAVDSGRPGDAVACASHDWGPQ